MTSTGTRTTAFTITDARHVGAKIGADLRLLNGYYGDPTMAKIDDYVEEVALLLKDGYLDNVSYGFRGVLTNEWKFRMRYTATRGGQLLNSPVGRLPATATVSGLSFYTYLIHSPSYMALSPSGRPRSTRLCRSFEAERRSQGRNQDRPETVMGIRVTVSVSAATSMRLSSGGQHERRRRSLPSSGCLA